MIRPSLSRRLLQPCLVLDAGLAERGGVCYWDSAMLVQTAEVLESRGHKLFANLLEFSLLHKRPDTSGTISRCM